MNVVAAISIVFSALLGSSEAIPDKNVAMVSSCRFRGGQSARLIVPIGSPKIFVTIRNRAGTNDLSSIEYGPTGSMEVDTNGGVSKIQFIVRLTRNLMRGPFEVTSKGTFKSLVARTPKRNCGISFDLSPH
jgi:hypothetical protein